MENEEQKEIMTGADKPTTTAKATVIDKIKDRVQHVPTWAWVAGGVVLGIATIFTIIKRPK